MSHKVRNADRSIASREMTTVTFFGTVRIVPFGTLEASFQLIGNQPPAAAGRVRRTLLPATTALTQIVR